MLRALVVAITCGCASATILAAAGTEPPLTDFVGTYEGDASSRLEIVAGHTLFAVIDEAKYALKRVGPDEFVARSGDRVVFVRDSAGAVSGYRVNGRPHAKQSTGISQQSADLAWPRPATRDQTVAYRYAAPSTQPDGIATGSAIGSALSGATLERVVQGVLDGTWPDVHSVLVHHRGRLVLEEYFYGYDAKRPHQMRSATKSVVSALAGIASTWGHAAQLNSHVLARLPYAATANPDSRKAMITMEHLLTMRSGLACDDHDALSPGNESKLYEASDWVKATLDLPMAHDPGEKALYCSGGVAVVGRLTELAAGKPLPEFAQEALFAPLGMQRADWRWNYQLTNLNREYSQIHLRPRDLLKFGLLFAQGGKWAGQQVVPAAWVKASLAAQTDIKGTGYGYFWWRPWLNVATAAGPQRVEYSAAQGNGGQKIFIVPQHDLVVVFTGGDYNSGSSPPNKIMSTVLLSVLIESAQPKRLAAPP